METELFSWEAWDMLDTMSFVFYDVVLVRKIGNFEAGTKFSSAVINYEDGRLVLYTDDSGKNEVTFNLSLNVSEDASEDA
jgi:hypothetical protein